jgi:mxaJ protein
MCFRCKAPAWRSFAWATCVALIFVMPVQCDNSPSLDGPQAQKRVLRITADPNNLPFSNDKLQGFENKIAEVIARDLNAEIHYSWRAQRRGFFRETLKADQCDLVMGVPVGFERALTTKPYYRSSYVFVSRKNSGWQINSFDDERLRSARVGVQLVGDDGMNTPPAHALAAHGVITNVVGFTLYGDYSEPNPPARIVDAVANEEIDVAVVWGPLGGYFAKREKIPLAINLINAEAEPPPLKFCFGIALGVKRGNKALRDELDVVLEKRKAEIDKILDEYGVPRVEKAKQTL